MAGIRGDSGESVPGGINLSISNFMNQRDSAHTIELQLTLPEKPPLPAVLHHQHSQQPVNGPYKNLPFHLSGRTKPTLCWVSPGKEKFA